MSSSSPMTPPPGGDQNRGPQLMAMYWIESILCVFLLSLRFYARRKIRGFGADDWMMLVTVVLFVITSCFVTKFALIGGARHVYYLTAPEVLNAVKWSWVSQPWATFLFAPGKAAVALLILRIIGPNSFWRKYFLWFLIVTIFIINSLGCIITFVQCNPPRALWTPSLVANGEAKCWSPLVQQNFNYFLAAWNIWEDVVLALLPITIFYNIRMNIKKKVALCCLLGLGLIGALFSGVKLKYITELASRTDFTWSSYDIEAWTSAEAFVMIVCGNIPPLQPLWDRYVSHKLDSNYGRTPINQYKMSERSGSYGQGRSYGKGSLPSTMAMASSNDVPDDEQERLYNKNTIHARTDVRVSESSLV